jgi:NAD(P)-dependent dehydrogenase (short-subunit alcohol dehydrogenase family)
MQHPEVSPVVLVTGSARGLGREVARQLALTGATVVVTAREPARAAATAEELRHANAGDVRALEVGLDVSDGASVKAATSELARTYGRMNVLVNNAAAYVAWDEQPSSADLVAAHDALETNPLRAVARDDGVPSASPGRRAPEDRQRLQRRRIARRP